MTAPTARPAAAPTWRRMRRTPVHGRARDLIECACGTRVWCYVWSWAGHGYRRCPGCGSRLMWTPDRRIDASERLRAMLVERERRP